MSTRNQRAKHRSPAAALELRGVSKAYELGGNKIRALDDVDLTVASQEVVILLGPSGSGKTTLLSLAGGLLSPTAGRVRVNGVDITRASRRKRTKFRRQHVGFIFQGVNLVPFLTARENLLIAAELAKRDRSAAKKRADLLLEDLGLSNRAKNLPGQLSGGERQRVGIARALMNAPGLVLVDEPTSALDSRLGEQVMELIVSKVKSRGAAAVIVTHDHRMARYGDRILNMADGRIASAVMRPEWTGQRAMQPQMISGPVPVAALPPAEMEARAVGAIEGPYVSRAQAEGLPVRGPARQLRSFEPVAPSVESVGPPVEPYSQSVFGPVAEPITGPNRLRRSDLGQPRPPARPGSAPGAAQRPRPGQPALPAQRAPEPSYLPEPAGGPDQLWPSEWWDARPRELPPAGETGRAGQAGEVRQTGETGRSGWQTPPWAEQTQAADRRSHAADRTSAERRAARPGSSGNGAAPPGHAIEPWDGWRGGRGGPPPADAWDDGARGGRPGADYWNGASGGRPAEAWDDGGRGGPPPADAWDSGARGGRPGVDYWDGVAPAEAAGASNGDGAWGAAGNGEAADPWGAWGARPAGRPEHRPPAAGALAGPSRPGNPVGRQVPGQARQRRGGMAVPTSAELRAGRRGRPLPRRRQDPNSS